MAVKALSERARARGELAVEQRQQRPQHGVLHERRRECQATLLDWHASPKEVEREPEQRAVQSVHRQAADEPNVGVVTAEQAPVERLLQSPDRRRDGSGRCRT